MRRFWAIWAMVAVFAVAWSARSQNILFGGANEKVRYAAEATPAEARRGETVELRVVATIEDGWHIYSMTPVTAELGPQPTRITLDAGALEPIGAFQQPDPESKFDSAFDMVVESFEDEVAFTQALLVPDDAPLGEQTVTATIRFMVCDAQTCLPPTTTEATVVISIVEGDARPEYIAAAPPTAPTDGRNGVKTIDALDKARSKGFVSYLGFAISMGFLALLTPCVFPMIPITVSFFTKKEGLTRSQGVMQAVIYCLGIMATFTGLGVLLAVLFGAASIQGVASNVWVNLLIAGVFVVFAFNLFGAFEIRVPYRVLNALGGSSQGTGQGTGVVATILMGLTFSLTSFTCTVPFVGTVLVAATQGELFWAITGMLGFSAAFASPFFLLALFPQLLASMPKAGGWLNSVKVTMGFLELAAALKFISNIDLVLDWGALPRELFLAAWIAIALVAAYYLLGKIRLPLDTPVETLGVARLMFALFFFAVSFYLTTGLFGKPLGELDAFLPPYAMGDAAGLVAVSDGRSATLKISHEDWLQSYDEGLAEAKATNRPIFIDFTGVTCTNCRWMEKNIFARSDVSALLDKYTLVQLWTDKATPESRANQQMQYERFGTVALPFYALMTPEDNVIDYFDGLTRDAEVFKTFLNGGLETFAANGSISMRP